MIPPQALPPGSSTHLPAWLNGTTVLWGCMALAVLLIAGATGFVWWERKSIIENTLASVEMLARALDDQSSRAVGTANFLMDTFDEDLSGYSDARSAAALNRLLTEAIAGAPFVRSFSLIDGDGQIVASSSPANRDKRIDPARLPDAAGKQPGEFMAIGRPVPGRDLFDSAISAAKDPRTRELPLSFVPLARTIKLKSGGNAHLVIALNTDYLANAYELMLAEAPRSAALLDYDGTALATTAGMPLPGGAGMGSHPVFKTLLSQHERGSFVGQGLDGSAAIGAYRASRRWPLVTVVEHSYTEALAPWHRILDWVAGATLAGLLFLSALGTAAWRSLRSNEQVRGALDSLHRDIASNEARKTAILTSAMDGMVTLDQHGCILEFNQEAERIFGHGAARAIGQPLEPLLFPPESRGLIAASQAEGAGSGPGQLTRRRFELTALRASGERFPVEISVVPVRANDQDYLSCTLRDISDARLAAEEREQLLIRYRDSSASLRLLKRALDQHAIVSIFSPDGTIVYANRKLASTSGYGREELVGHRNRFLRPTGGTEPIEHDLLALIQAGRPWEGQLVHQKKDGALYWAASTIVPILDSNGRLRQAFLIQTDISRQIAGERATEAARRTELELGAGIQRGLLMRDLPGSVLDCSLAGFNVASQGINGDFVDLFQFSDDCFDILVGDAMGKGVPAALLGAGLKMQFARSLAELHTQDCSTLKGHAELPSPAQIVAHVQHAMHPHLQQLESFVTVCYLRVDRARGTLTWVGCGHEETLLLRGDADYSFLPNQHPPLGVIEEATIEEKTVPFLPGDTLVLYSDGLADAVAPDGERFGMQRLTDTVRALLRTHCRPGTIARGMQRTMEAFVQGGRIADDMTMLVLQTPGAGTGLREWRFEMPRALDRLSALRIFVMARAQACGLAEERASALALAAVELASNAIRHGGDRDAGPLEAIFGSTMDECRLELLYLGQPFVPPARLEPDFSGSSEGGFGLYIIRQSCDAVRYSHADGVNRMVLTKRRAG
ncbi:SpoIIE family protein phosphatase [Cupriavidus basilensis]|uniref:SpoIIE family protein phosphatase n=1 Tax=Cupriavidus basilensis TaxID=68895 RepID=A0ABT6B5S6_9BURK|nr:SpoIIE family protein phosphatase [Cupriavidus basilensis]MDF3840043.1 SpoIIE family protein phosphatase [Cupriavidus basilensis]